MKRDKLKLNTFVLLILACNTLFSQTPIPDIFSPTFSHSSGRYNADILVHLTTRTPNANIYYTLDGSDPDNNSQLFTGNISIAGDGNYTELRTITIDQNFQKSKISSAIYILDYSFNPNNNYLTNLTWAQYNDYIQGDWFGYSSNPWTNDYNVILSILPTGNYIDLTTSSGGYYPYYDDFPNVFYNGISNPSPLKTISLYNLLPTGFANGFVVIDFGSGSTNTDDLRFIKFIDEKNMYLEVWHHSIYGPLKYYLTKTNHSVPTGISKFKNENTSFYPNPTSDFLFIKNLNSNVQLINQLGQNFILEKNEKLSVSHLPRGLYILLFENSDGVQVKQKLILE